MKKPAGTISARWLTTLLLAILIQSLGACTDASPPQTAQHPALPVSVVKVQNMTVPIYGEAVGNTDAVETVEIRSRVDGHLLHRFFEDGALVQKDDLLFQIDPDQYEQDLARSKAQLDFSRVSLDLARKETQRYATLLRKAMISQEEYDLKKIKEQEAEANVVVNEAGVNLAKLNIRHTRITSPISGRIGFSEVDQGALISTGSTLLAKVSTVDPMYFYFFLTEEDYLNLADHYGENFHDIFKTLEVQLTLAGGLVYDQVGHLDMFDRQVDPKTGTIAARAVFSNPEGMLRPGMFGRVRITLEEQWELLLIPQQAIMETLGQQSVFLVDDQGAVSSRNVVLGGRMKNLRAVTDGLEPGDRIAIDGLQKLRPGMRVNATEVSYALETDEAAPAAPTTTSAPDIQDAPEDAPRQ